MARFFPQNELDQIALAVGAHPSGVAISELGKQFPSISSHNLKRRLARLVETGRIDLKGERKAARYFPKPTRQEARPRAENELLLSREATEVQALVQRPITKRAPVGYNRHFLDRYRPNQTAYLTEEQRAELWKAGMAPAQEGPAGTYARRILERLLIDLAFNSSRLEGNTYSLLETQRLIALGHEATGKDARDAQMILNHKQAIEFLVGSPDPVDFDSYTVINLHALLANNLLANPSAVGSLRTIPVGIGHSTYMPLEVPQLIKECFNQILDTARAIKDPFERSFFILVHIPYLQPFEDVNKRVSRIAANIPFIQANLSPLSFVEVPQDPYIQGLLGVYENERVELLRDVFIWAYKRSALRYAAVRQVLGEPDPFRLAHREAISQIIAEIVREASDVEDASRRVQQYASKEIQSEHRERFTEVVETELLNLHEGNIARYRLRPSEYEGWNQRSRR